MKILYGVQATGNGHITRARSMARAFKAAGIEVDYLFSGRDRDQLFNMEVFGDYRHRQGLSFATCNGRLQYIKTALINDPVQFVRDVRALDLKPYDLVITDFEPITAWAAKLQQAPVLGIGDQYAFRHTVPVAGGNPLSRWVLKYFAPARRCLGMHWHHYNAPILPPMIEPPKYRLYNDSRKVLVYLPFEEITDISKWLGQFGDYQFIVYCSVQKPDSIGNVCLQPFSRDGFQYDLATCAGVICGAGFGLVSEALQCGKKLLVKSIKGQMEQLSNARAIRELGLGDVIDHFDRDVLEQWLDKPLPEPRSYPDVAMAIVNWIQSGFQMQEAELVRRLWAAWSEPCSGPGFPFEVKRVYALAG